MVEMAVAKAVAVTDAVEVETGAVEMVAVDLVVEMAVAKAVAVTGAVETVKVETGAVEMVAEGMAEVARVVVRVVEKAEVARVVVRVVEKVAAAQPQAEPAKPAWSGLLLRRLGCRARSTMW